MHFECIEMMDHKLYKENSIFGRYVTQESLLRWFGKNDFDWNVIGHSVNGKKIKAIQLGNGPTRILMWSQMHGNESTTTKALVDVFNFLQSDHAMADSILENCSLFIIPILNPDGAENYTRSNAVDIDLNRDAKNRTQPESIALRAVFETFEPHFCFNLHDQRTIFSAGDTNNPATVSFLSPASDPERKLTPARETSMKLIVAMNRVLQEVIPNQIGRYDDSFNDNCIGDSFQMADVPTILFEAGHFQGDYEREETRAFIFKALFEVLRTISMDDFQDIPVGEYFKIPENKKLFYDILIKNSALINPKIESENNLAIQFKEILQDDAIIFKPELASIGKLDAFYGHKTLDCTKTEDVKWLNSHKKILDLVLLGEA